MADDTPPSPATSEPPLSSEVAARRRGLRSGWTTGTCASAAAKAAAIGLVTGTVPDQVEVGLPDGRRVSFSVERPTAATAVVIKDAGDDPDCTDGAHVTAHVAWHPTAPPCHGATTADGDGLVSSADDGVGASDLLAGPGVGTVTKPGLGLPVGGPSITKVPRRMILAALAEVTDRRLVVTFSVPGGEAMAAKTTNDRLGIVGGISILGTTGVVKPFSTAAYRASVVQQIDVAAAQGASAMVLCTGSRSEQTAFALWPDLDPVTVVEVGDFSGIALRRAASAGMTSVAVVAMAGKITKLAAGVMMTHFHRSAVDGELLARVAREMNAPEPVVAAATETATARHFAEACVAAGTTAPLERLCELARDNCVAHAGGSISCEVVMVDFEGEDVWARA